MLLRTLRTASRQGDTCVRRIGAVSLQVEKKNLKKKALHTSGDSAGHPVPDNPSASALTPADGNLRSERHSEDDN
eukprot:scaffold19262_cov117-Isochrysis_galbana.AAC.3